MAEKARHAFGSELKIAEALAAGKIDAYDILFLDEKKVGWINKSGEVVIAETDLSGVEAEISTLEAELANKVDVTEVDAKVESAVESAVESTISTLNQSYEKTEYEVSYKPEGTLVDYRDKEIRIMCPTNTEWVLQNSGENADKNMYYIGFKAYSPENAVSFKEDLAKTITDTTMYYFEGNDFAGVDEQGRKYSIAWLPAAKYDETNGTWTYYGANSTAEKYIGWYYSVEWYNADGVLIASDCIRINLSNEDCHASIEPYYMGDMMKEIETKIAEVSAYEIIEF